MFCYVFCVFFFKQKTAYEMLISDWSSDVCSSDLAAEPAVAALLDGQRAANQVWALHAERSGQGNPEGLRRLLLAIVRDLRVVPILLARQLAQLRAAAQLPEDERIALAQLTRDIHAPLANQIGRAHVGNPVTNAHLVCSLLPEKKNTK